MLIKTTQDANSGPASEHACFTALMRMGWAVQVAFNKATASKPMRMEVLTARTFRDLVDKCSKADAEYREREKKRAQAEAAARAK